MINTLGYESLPSLRYIGQYLSRLSFALKRGENTGTGAGHLNISVLLQPLTGCFYLRVELFRYGLASISATLPEKGAYCDGVCVPCQFLV